VKIQVELILLKILSFDVSPDSSIEDIESQIEVSEKKIKRKIYFSF
jgi:hypothetical protein